MAETNITPAKVIGVMQIANQALINKDFNQAEVMLGLQELVGRVIVDMASTMPGALELIGHAAEHLADTVRIGMQAKGVDAPRIVLPQ